MADKKISALTSVTLPLAGTEVLPIVQSSTTKKVASDDLTVKNIRSNATSGLLQVVGPAAASTRVMTVPDANFTIARTDAVNSFTGDQTLATGNLVIGTAGKGVDFSADPSAPGMTSELFDDYEEGTWTPADSSGAGLTFTNPEGRYTKIGRMVYATLNVTFPSTVDTSIATISLPFAATTESRPKYGGFVSYTDYGTAITGIVGSGAATFIMYTYGASVVRNNNASGKSFRMVFVYDVA